MVTTASPAWLVLFVTMAPKDARSPKERNRGTACSSVSGLVARTSASPAPKCDDRSPATAMMRYVVSESGNVTVVVARPLASVVAEPSQKTSDRKSVRISPGCSAPASARSDRGSVWVRVGVSVRTSSVAGGGAGMPAARTSAASAPAPRPRPPAPAPSCPCTWRSLTTVRFAIRRSRLSWVCTCNCFRA